MAMRKNMLEFIDKEDYDPNIKAGGCYELLADNTVLVWMGKRRWFFIGWESAWSFRDTC